MGPLWRVVKEIKAAAKAEWIFVWFIEGLALGFFPEGVWIERDIRARSGRGRVTEKRVWFHLVKLSVGVARSAQRKGESAMATLVDGDRNAVENDSLAVPSFSGRHNVGRHVVQAGGGRGEGIGLAIEFLGNGADEPKIDADFAEVTSHLLDTKHARFGLDAPMDLSPEIGMGALGRGMAVNDLLEPVDHRLVVDKDMNRPFGAGSEVDDGKGLRDLGVLRETMDTRTVIQTVGNTVIDAKTGSSQERDSLVCAGAVGGRVGPGPPGEWVGVRSIRVGTLAWWGGSGDGLGHWVSGQLSLKVEERRILVKEATVARVRRKPGPLFVADEIREGGSLAFPALAVANGMLLGLFLFVAVTTEGAWVGRSF